MSTRTLIIAGVILLVLMFIMLFSRGPSEEVETQEEQYVTFETDVRWEDDVRDILDSPDNTTVEGQQLVLLGVAEGDRLSVPDFRVLPTTQEMGSGFYQLHAGVETRDRTFGITYASFDNSFSVGLARKPLHLARQDAEEHLKEILGLSEEELCKLRVQVMVPSAVDATYSGQNLGLSFCEGSIPLN